ncbi:MAG: hypothetical protein Q4A54_10805, partial [Parabacteroides sp.]|nr:hypothetical protein [Parabacteroides sp.]
MKKITSFLTLMVLCSVVALAQEVVGSELPVNKQIKIGTAQAEVVPGKWYVVYNPRPSAGSSLAQDFVLPGESIPWTGGLVVDMGAGERVRKSQTVIIDEMNSENGVNANDYMNYLVRFCVPDSLEGVYNLQFGTGNWLASQLSSVSSQSDAGMYNFYLVTINDIPNSFGRFGWNKFDMADRVDNNGAGNTVAFWDSGIITGESENWTSAEQISANKIWQIFDIHILGDADIYAYALEDLLDEYSRITGSQDGAFIEILQNGVNVGTSYGNYRPEDVAAFLTIQANVENLMFTWEMDGREAVQVQYPHTDDLTALIQEYSGAVEALEANKIPLAMTSIAPGY